MQLSPLIYQYLTLVGWVIFLSMLFYPFELLAPAEKGQPIGKRLINLIYAPLFLAMAVFLLQPLLNPLAGGLLAVTWGGVLPSALRPGNSYAGQFLFAAAFAIWWDLWQYWLHRLQHCVPWLWETHKFHHSETALNATTQTRHHIIHALLSYVFYLPVLIVCGTESVHYLALFVMFRLWGFVNHANLRVGIGPLTPIISGPQWHRIHHSVLGQHQDKNFATFFPFIDKLFGTYYRPCPNEYPPSGLCDGEEPRPMREATIAPFIAWYRTSVGGLSRTLRSLFFRLRLLVRSRA